MTYREQQETFKVSRILSWPIVTLSLIQFAMIFFFDFVARGDQSSGYVTAFFQPLVYLVSFALIVTPILQIRNKTIGLLDLILVFIVLIATYMLLSGMNISSTSSQPGNPATTTASQQFNV